MDTLSVVLLIALVVVLFLWRRSSRKRAAPPVPEGVDDVNEHVLGRLVGLVYVDERGRQTERAVTMWRLYNQNGRRYLQAYCHLRKENRTFRVDRIVEVFDPKTGEIIGNIC